MTPKAFSAALILAGGASRRMGFPKALVQLNGTSLIEAHIQSLTAFTEGPIAVLLGHQADRLLPQINPGPAYVVINSKPERGQLSSIQVGLEALEDRCSIDPDCGVFLTPVDCPPVPSLLLDQMIQTFNRLQPGALVPTCDGQPGHPVLLGREAIDTIQTKPTEARLCGILDEIHTRILLEVNHPSILWNLNRPADLTRYLHHL